MGGVRFSGRGLTWLMKKKQLSAVHYKAEGYLRKQPKFNHSPSEGKATPKMESREMQVKGVNAHLSRPGNLVCAGHTVTSVKAPPCTKKKKKNTGGWQRFMKMPNRKTGKSMKKNVLS